MDFIEISGYKSIHNESIDLKPINLLIGANGSGKSNFISFFDFLNKLYNRNLNEFRKYHFHDTSNKSPFTQLSSIENDIYYLYNNGANLAAFLYDIKENNRIVKTIQSIAPYFSDFEFIPNNENYLRLQWKD
ncbi:MAG: AAA family ATPase [Marinilabiliaceae bacterium]|nr:AAA family ATPase [Marinilabiliaceae bacterium]